MVKKINFEEGSFTADGRKFIITDSLPVDYFMEFERVQNSMGFNMGFKQIFDKLKDIYSLLNSNKLLDAGIKLYNLMGAVAEKVDSKIHPDLEICALFIIEEGEERTVYNKETSKSKIDAWRKEGYDMQDFFTLAINLVVGFTESYVDFMENISKLAAITEQNE